MTKPWLFSPVGKPVKMPTKLPLIHTPNEGVGGGPPLDEWIFADGTWSDTGVWQDAREWAFAGLFYEGLYWDGGVWDDGEDW